MENETYKIIKIIDDYRVVINAGKQQGVTPGMEFEIFIKGVELKDDVTGESYGSLDYIKGVVEAVNIMEHVSVCRNTNTYTKTVSPFDIPALEVFKGTTKEFIKPLGVEQTQITGYGFSTDKTIRIGDLVRER